MNKMQIAFVRHGVTTWNLEGRRQGTHDFELTEDGISQAKMIGETLASLNVPFKIIYTSPLKRAVQTAQIIANRLGLQTTIYQQLHELDFGCWTGLTQTEIEERYSELLKERERDKWNFRLPGGESYCDGYTRVLPFLNEVVNLGSNCIVVSHSTIGRIMIGQLLGYSSQQTLEIKHPFWIVYLVDPKLRTITYVDSIKGISRNGIVIEFDYDRELSPYKN